MKKVFVLHENADWSAPLFARLQDMDVPFEDWNLVEGTVNIDDVPPEGVFYNRMSASSYTRGHRYSPEYAAVVLSWLEAHGRSVVNGSAALALEINKAAQYQLLKTAGIKTPRSVIAVGKSAMIEAAAGFDGEPFILKPNRGGKGDGVILFNNSAELVDYLNSDQYVAPADGIAMVQEYLPSVDGAIIRAEFIDGKHFYSVRVDTGGAFELCPADVCQVPGAAEGPTFTILDADQAVPRALIERLEKVLGPNGVDVAGVEFMRHVDGTWYSYDINTNTNYNPVAENAAGLFGMKRLAAFLAERLGTTDGGDVQHIKAAS